MSSEKEESETMELSIPQILPLLPLRNTVMFPQQILPLSIGREKSVRLIDDAMRANRLLLVVAQRDGRIDDPQTEDLFQWGTISLIMKVFKMPDGTHSAMVQGIARGRILDFVQADPYIK